MPVPFSGIAIGAQEHPKTPSNFSSTSKPPTDKLNIPHACISRPRNSSRIEFARESESSCKITSNKEISMAHSDRFDHRNHDAARLFSVFVTYSATVASHSLFKNAMLPASYCRTLHSGFHAKGYGVPTSRRLGTKPTSVVASRTSAHKDSSGQNRAYDPRLHSRSYDPFMSKCKNADILRVI